MREKIKHLASLKSQYIIEIRRHLHQFPELSFQEYNTRQLIIEQLTKLGLKAEIIAGTGVQTLLKPEKKGEKTIVLRADTDALPVTELNDFPYKSTVEGVMHACGHDAHTAMLLGVAAILTELKESFSGNVKFIFQPAEEKLPGGAKQMIEEGVLNSHNIRSVLAQHVFPELPVGKAGFCSGRYMASTDEIYIKVKGKGGHAAVPWVLIDPVSISAQLITSLQQIISRKTPAFIPSVLSFGKIIANGATNVIPDEVFIEGTFRTFDEKHRNNVHDLIQSICHSVVNGMQAEVELEIKKGYPVLFNDSALTSRAVEYACSYLGNDHVVELPPRMTSEDFSYYSQHKPSLFYRIGTAFTEKDNFPLHNARFDIDENSLQIGAGLMSFITISELANEY